MRQPPLQLPYLDVAVPVLLLLSLYVLRSLLLLGRLELQHQQELQQQEQEEEEEQEQEEDRLEFRFPVGAVEVVHAVAVVVAVVQKHAQPQGLLQHAAQVLPQGAAYDDGAWGQLVR